MTIALTTKAQEAKKATRALSLIVPLLNKHDLRWIITGGFACYAYGVKRKLTDIDIDIDVSKDSAKFQNFYSQLKPYLTQPLQHLVDKNYDNYNFEIAVDGQIIDICPMAELKICNPTTKRYEHFYSNGFPRIEMVSFGKFKLPLLAKDLIIKNKQMLPFKRESDLTDIQGLIALKAKKHKTMNVIIVSGTPGTGKSTIAKLLSRISGYSYLDVNKLIIEKKLSDGYDKKRKCKIVDILRLNQAIIMQISHLKKNKKIKAKGLVIDSHLSHYLPRKYVDLCIITTSPLPLLKRRLQKRGYSKQKIRENLDAEIFSVCLNEALENKLPTYTIDTSQSKKTVQTLLTKQLF